MRDCFKPTSVSRLHLRVGSIAVASLTSLALVLAARPATAGPEADTAETAETAETADAAESAPSDDPLEQAQALYERGRAAFETADYDGAITAWTDAYSSVPDTPDAARIKALLIYNIATAREKLYSVTNDPKHLRQAKSLLEEFEKSIPALYAADDVAAETERVRERIGAIDGQLSEADSGSDSGSGTSSGSGPGSGTGRGADDGGSSDGKGLVIGGAVALGLGVAGLGMMGAGLGIGAQANDISELGEDDIDGRRDQFARGRTGNVLAIAGGVAGGLLAVTGAVLVGLGVKKKRSSVAWGPGPAMAGLSVAGRF